MASQRSIPLAVLIDGYGAAVARYHAARLGQNADAAFLPLFEALSWTASIDERLDLPDLPELRGMRYARHAVYHLWADALVRTEGRSYPKQYPFVYFEWRWRVDLPVPRNRNDEAAYKAAYKEGLAGQPARLALAAVERFLKEQVEATTDR